LLKPIK